MYVGVECGQRWWRPRSWRRQGVGPFWWRPLIERVPPEGYTAVSGWCPPMNGTRVRVGTAVGPIMFLRGQRPKDDA